MSGEEVAPINNLGFVAHVVKEFEHLPAGGINSKKNFCALYYALP